MNITCYRSSAAFATIALFLVQFVSASPAPAAVGGGNTMTTNTVSAVNPCAGGPPAVGFTRMPPRPVTVAPIVNHSPGNGGPGGMQAMHPATPKPTASPVPTMPPNCAYLVVTSTAHNSVQCNTFSLTASRSGAVISKSFLQSSTPANDLHSNVCTWIFITPVPTGVPLGVSVIGTSVTATVTIPSGYAGPGPYSQTFTGL